MMAGRRETHSSRVSTADFPSVSHASRTSGSNTTEPSPALTATLLMTTCIPKRRKRLRCQWSRRKRPPGPTRAPKETRARTQWPGKNAWKAGNQLAKRKPTTAATQPTARRRPEDGYCRRQYQYRRAKSGHTEQ
eukprot:TRINITY_DN15011_c0_g2_i1.p2 TRINITY_DN15011_c0_g2~~TRINITY_DN15011_c0_g2_i1.p2  ORF type:complete len:134 (+),score=6.08 TRINITY_DN15011_c0_g2_i1:159-560(+)